MTLSISHQRNATQPKKTKERNANLNSSAFSHRLSHNRNRHHHHWWWWSHWCSGSSSEYVMHKDIMALWVSQYIYAVFDSDFSCQNKGRSSSSQARERERAKKTHIHDEDESRKIVKSVRNTTKHKVPTSTKRNSTKAIVHHCHFTPSDCVRFFSFHSFSFVLLSFYNSCLK